MRPVSGFALEAGIEAEFAHVGHQRPRGGDEGVAVAGGVGFLEVIEGLVHGRAGIALAVLSGFESRADVLEFAEHLRHAVGFGAEMPQGKVGAALSSALSGAFDLELRAAGVLSAGILALQAVAPGFDKKALNESGFGGGFLEDFAGGPGFQVLMQGFRFRGGGEGLVFRMPVGSEESVVKERKEGHGDSDRAIGFRPVDDDFSNHGRVNVNMYVHGGPSDLGNCGCKSALTPSMS